MSVKNLLILVVAGVAAIASSFALAGGPDVVPPLEANDVGIYAEGNVGYGFTNWGNEAFPGVINTSNGHGGVTAGGDVGYQWTENLAAELGASYLSQVKGIVTSPVPVPGATINTFKLDNWFAYFAMKLMAPVFFVDNLDIFFKAGLAYRPSDLFVTDPFDNETSGNVNHWGPVFATGLLYQYQNWLINAQWMYLTEREKVVSTSVVPVFSAVPPAYLLTLGLGYRFAV